MVYVMRNRNARLRSLLLGCVCLFCLSISAQANAFRVLFIGNSFTGFSQSSLERFRNTSPLGDDEFGYIFVGGASLDFHRKQAGTIEAIRNGQWDYVVLQDHSRQTLFLLDLFDSAVRELTTVVRESGAEPILFQTWARLEDGSYSPRQQLVNRRYNELAAELDIHVMSVGQTWLSIYNSDRAYFNRLHDPDRIHQTPLGASIVAGAAYKFLYDTDLSWAPMEPTARSAVLTNVATRPAHQNTGGESPEPEVRIESIISLLLD